MKNVISKNKFVLVVLITVLFFSCAGEDGAMGPPGQDGANGQDGNANVISVLIPNVSFVDGEKTLSVPELTQDILDNGAVIGYLRNTGESTWFALPLSFSGFEVYIQSLQLGSITIRANYVGNQTDFRFVLIEASDKSAGKSNIINNLKNSGIDINDYNQVVAYYGLDN